MSPKYFTTCLLLLVGASASACGDSTDAGPAGSSNGANAGTGAATGGTSAGETAETNAGAEHGGGTNGGTAGANSTAGADTAGTSGTGGASGGNGDNGGNGAGAGTGGAGGAGMCDCGTGSVCVVHIGRIEVRLRECVPDPCAPDELACDCAVSVCDESRAEFCQTASDDQIECKEPVR